MANVYARHTWCTNAFAAKGCKAAMQPLAKLFWTVLLKAVAREAEQFFNCDQPIIIMNGLGWALDNVDEVLLVFTQCHRKQAMLVFCII